MKTLFVATLLVLALGLVNSYDYGDVLRRSLLFYEAQRSGKLPSNNRIDWRWDSALNDEIVGGYYDAGDHVKFGFPMAAMTTQLAWGAVSFEEGYSKAGEIQHMKECLKWSTDYFIAAHKSDFELVAQIGDGGADHGYWGRPEDMTMNRPSFSIDANRPGSDLAGETAAALAASSMFYKSIGDNGAADEALSHARKLFDFADQKRAKYTDSVPEAAGFYNSWSGFNDELGWAAAWMYKATGENQYLEKAESFYDQFNLDYTPTEFSWDNKVAGVQVLLFEATGKDKYKQAVEATINSILYGSLYTPKGLIYIDSWGSLRHAANMAHLCLQVAKTGLFQDECRNFATNQIGYALGDTGRSFVVGYGTNPPQRPHHRSSSCPDRGQDCSWDAYNNPGPNYQTLDGALVGGPNNQDQYTDSRQDYESNEVATDYNAGFQSALAGLNA